MKKFILAVTVSQLIMLSSFLAIADEADSFLRAGEVADSLRLLPPPPAYNSVDFLRDKALYDEGRSLMNTDRWEQAIKDADLSDANIGKPFSEALGMEISAKNTPVTYHLLKKIRKTSGGFATNAAKQHYMRVRPFMFFNTQSCVPEDEQFLRKNGSYPSGHTTIGWSSALILAEIRPDRQDHILKRGYEFGQSRVICGAHWQSDVDAGRIIGASIVARLHADKSFAAELEKAKKEIRSKINQ
jgi:acid phosphatase (class A)